MGKREAIADGLVSFLCLLVAMLGALEALMNELVAAFLAFLTAFLGAPMLVLLHRAMRTSLEHAALAYLLLTALGTALFWLKNPLGPWALLAYMAILITPLFSRSERSAIPRTRAQGVKATVPSWQRPQDNVTRLLELARAYGGVLTTHTVSEELGFELKEAGYLLGFLCAHGLAQPIGRGQPIAFLFPSIIGMFPEPARSLILMLARCPRGITEADLAFEAARSGLDMGLLEAALEMLMRRGLVSYRRSSGRYVLRCFTRRRG